MEEPLDEDGRSRVPSRPTVKKKDGLDDPALADAGPDLDSRGETADLGPNHPEAVAQESRPGGVDQSLNDSAAGVSGNPEDAAPQSGLNSGDTCTEAVSIVSDGVAPVDGNPGGVTAEVVQSPRNVARGGISNPYDVAQAGVVGIPASDIAPGAVGNLGDTVPAAISNRDDVAPAVWNSGSVAPGMAENFDDDALEAVQNLNNVTLGAEVSNPNDVVPEIAGNPDDVALEAVENPNSDASEAVLVPSDVAPGVVENPLNVVLGSDLNPDDTGHVLAPNPDNVAPVAGNHSDGTLGVDSGPDDVAIGVDGEPADGAVQNPGMVEECEIVDMEQDSASQADHQNGDKDEDEFLWSKAVAEQDCNKLRVLLAKDVTYFWKYEKKNDFGTTLHAAAEGGDIELADHVLYLLSWAQKAGDLDIRFSDTRLDIDRYVELERNGKTAAQVAGENNLVAIENKIRDYISNKDKRCIRDKRSRGSTTSINCAPPEMLKWNVAIKRKDCLALLQICPKKKFHIASNVEKKLIGELVNVEMKNGKGGRRTALQTAAMQGCFQLAKLMLYHFRHVPGSIASGDDIVDYILARDEESGLTAFEMANDVIANRSISEYIKGEYEKCGQLKYIKAIHDKFGLSHNIERMIHLNEENDMHRIGDFPELYSFDAYPGTRWYRALENGDPIELKKLVEVNSRFILETCHGLTVLHVAILRDDLELVKVILNLFCDKSGKENKTSIHWGSSYHPEELSLDDMMKVCRKIEHGYLNEYWKDSSETWEPLPKHMLQQLQRKNYTVESLAQILKRKEILGELEKALNISTTTSTPSTPSMEHSTMPPWLCKFFDEVIWTQAFDEEFQKDVDFNFEDPSRMAWLRVHYACKDPLKFKGFLQHMAFCIMKPPYDGVKLLQTWDGKGRTPFHILMDHYNDEMGPGWPFDEIFKHDCFKEMIQTVENPRGKRIIDTIFSKNYLQQNITLHPWTYFKINFNYEKFERSEVTTFLCYQIACLLKQMDMVREIWSRFLKKKDFTSVMKKDQDAFNSMLFLVASTGNQTCLQSLLEINHDPMITDSNGRSLLHHAADPTLLLSHLLGYCSLTIEDVCDMRRKFLGSKTICYQQLASSTIPDISSGESLNVGRKACILMLLQAGVDLGQSDKDNKVPTIGPTIDTTDQSWWYDMVVKDSTDKKNALGQAGNALSVVGTLVAATSYVGPLQPPLSLDSETGFVKTTEPLIKVFMVSNSVAFYLAMASVMFAVVSSLPMPQEGVMSEVNRAKHVISLSLCLLQIAIGSIVISYATASIVAIQNEHLFHRSDLLFIPSIIGWFFCLLGIGGFLIRLARLVFYKNAVVRNIYEISFSKVISKCLWVIVGRSFLVVLLLGCLVLVLILGCLAFLCSKIQFLKRSRIYLLKVAERFLDFANTLRV